MLLLLLGYTLFEIVLLHNLSSSVNHNKLPYSTPFCLLGYEHVQNRKAKRSRELSSLAFKVKRVLVDKLGSYHILSADLPPGSNDHESNEGKAFILCTSNNEISITVMTMAMTNQILHHVMNISFAKDIRSHLENKYNRVYSTTALRRSLHSVQKGNQSIQK